MTQVETQFGKQMQEALKLPEPERTAQFAKLKNRYNTKQSTTRKKYGIRLREKRTKEDIEAERVRLLGPDGADIWMDMEHKARGLKPGHEGTPIPASGGQTPGTKSSPQRPAQKDIGGLGISAGPAEATDPTTQMDSSQPRDMARLHQDQSAISKPPIAGGSRDDPMDIEEGAGTKPPIASNGHRQDSSSSEDDQSSSGNEDTPVH